MLINQREPAEFLTSFDVGTSHQKCFNCEFNLSRPPPTHKIICHISDERDGIFPKTHKKTGKKRRRRQRQRQKLKSSRRFCRKHKDKKMFIFISVKLIPSALRWKLWQNIYFELVSFLVSVLVSFHWTTSLWQRIKFKFGQDFFLIFFCLPYEPPTLPQKFQYRCQVHRSRKGAEAVARVSLYLYLPLCICICIWSRRRLAQVLAPAGGQLELVVTDCFFLLFFLAVYARTWFAFVNSQDGECVCLLDIQMLK